MSEGQKKKTPAENNNIRHKGPVALMLFSSTLQPENLIPGALRFNSNKNAPLVNKNTKILVNTYQFFVEKLDRNSPVVPGMRLPTFSYHPGRQATGRRRPIPKALVVTLSPGAAWRRLNSARSTRRITSRTSARSKPRAAISSDERFSSI